MRRPPARPKLMCGAAAPSLSDDEQESGPAVGPFSAGMPTARTTSTVVAKSAKEASLRRH